MSRYLITVDDLRFEQRVKNPWPAEAALLAHLLMSGDRARQIADVELTDAGDALLDIITEVGGAACASYGNLQRAALAFFTGDDDLLRDMMKLASMVDTMAVLELAALGSLEAVASTLGVTWSNAKQPPARKRSRRFGQPVTATIAGLDMAVGQ